jgi:hypothetical protein
MPAFTVESKLETIPDCGLDARAPGIVDQGFEEPAPARRVRDFRTLNSGAGFYHISNSPLCYPKDGQHS